jgi:hypothetical protein
MVWKLKIKIEKWRLRGEATPYLVKALAAVSQPFFLYLGNKITFCFPIKKHLTIDSLKFSYTN